MSTARAVTMKKSADQMAKGGTHMVHALKNDRWKETGADT
jgi:hypothetical protein